MLRSHRDDVEILVDLFKKLADSLQFFKDLVLDVLGAHGIQEYEEVYKAFGYSRSRLDWKRLWVCYSKTMRRGARAKIFLQ